MKRKPWESRYASPAFRSTKPRERLLWDDREEVLRERYRFGLARIDDPNSRHHTAGKHALLIPESVLAASQTPEEDDEMVFALFKKAGIRKVNHGWSEELGGMVFNFRTEEDALSFRLLCPLPTQLVNKDE
ncbi:MAG: hypothetical protein EOP83_14505 [Verrucomicrobiaceae bacterium]|nr:MAG: hypothetical protein EOP83_14505 [Verrucomicrobiaceae bacterium]